MTTFIECVGALALYCGFVLIVGLMCSVNTSKDEQ